MTHTPSFLSHATPARVLLLASALLLSACGDGSSDKNQAQLPDSAGDEQGRVAWVDKDRIVNADSEPGNWMTTGRTYSEQRYSPLDQINDSNTNQLGLAWYYDIDTARGQEATPIVVDGVMYVSTAWSHVVALDAASGKEIWAWDSDAEGPVGYDACCDVVNRGVAVWKGKVYVGTLDGRLVALDAKTGKEVWDVRTFPEDQQYTSTGAPRVINGKVIIGNAGAENAVRGYISAYDAETGKMVWRFYTVPGDPSKGFESPAVEMAAKTWSGEWWKVGGGGGSTWNGMAYDPDLNLLYFGVGNGGPFNKDVRSPGGGDNLFTDSIVAVNADTGEYVWHFQETPMDSWDYDANEDLILANITIDGEPQKVIMQASKNGFFYVLDRTNGTFISGNNFVKVNWATGLDDDGHPKFNPKAWYMDNTQPFLVSPGPAGAHNWNPMSFSPKTGLAYIPAQDVPFVFPGGKADRDNPPKMPKIPDWTGSLVAWNPVTQTAAWHVDLGLPFNGGTLATAGNLVFQGTPSGKFYAYKADTGERVWEWDMQSQVMAGPISYTAKDEQYVAVTVGLGGGGALVSSDTMQREGPLKNISRVVAVKLNGNATLPPVPEDKRVLNPPPVKADAATVAKGGRLYAQYCARCHGAQVVGNGVLPDLRYSTYLNNFSWFDIVVRGSLQRTGMKSFGNLIKRDEATAIREYVISRAQALKQAKDAGQ